MIKLKDILFEFIIKCKNCGWKWQSADSHEFDKYICHKCLYDNKNNKFISKNERYIALPDFVLEETKLRNYLHDTYGWKII